MTTDADPSRWSPARRLTLASAAVSLGLAGGLGAVHLASGSQLALAQAADSVSDVFMAAALLWAIRISTTPPSEDYPVGHQRAEPLAALLTAFVAGMLAIEVMRGAVGAIVGAEPVLLEWPLAAMFGAKVVAKSVIALLARARAARLRNPALRALHVDARNDVAVGTLAVVGFFAARYGWAGLDAWLALPVGLWIGASGVELARENVRLLMGGTVDARRRDELGEVARATAGVRSVRHVRAVHQGAAVDVLVHVVVDPALPLREAHDIGHAVEARLIEEPDVCHAVAHLDVEPDVR